MSDKGSRDKTKERGEGARTTAEWTTLVLSAVVVGSLIVALLYQQFEDAPGDARLSAEPHIDAAEQANGQYYLPIRVANSGKTSAERVNVELVSPDQEEPLAEIEVEAVPGFDDVTVIAVLDEEPPADLEAKVTSYVEP